VKSAVAREGIPADEEASSTSSAAAGNSRKTLSLKYALPFHFF
jgi:hypothetical protein